MDIPAILNITQIVLSVFLIGAILLQQRGAGSSAIMGSGGGGAYYARRGFEKFLYNSTIVLSIAFLAISLVVFIIK